MEENCGDEASGVQELHIGQDREEKQGQKDRRGDVGFTAVLLHVPEKAHALAHARLSP